MEGDIHSEEHAGIVPRSVKAILEQLEASDSEYTIRVSFLELYNEELQDLLTTNNEKKLKLCEDLKKGVVCQNLEEVTVQNVGDIFEILQKGIFQRQTAETLMNKNSSRSHSIFTMKIMIKECNVDGEEVVRHGQLNLVDLAGSECIGRSGAKNDRAREAGSINQV
jgi:kinesin family protein 11